jgi:hypothetical protein
VRSVLAISLVCFFGCDSGSRATPLPAAQAKPVEVLLARSAGLPPFEIQATFPVGQDPAPHIQPITAALAGARAACTRDTAALAAVLDVEVHGKRVHATARNPSAACLARAIDGSAIDDPSDYTAKLLVSVG